MSNSRKSSIFRVILIAFVAVSLASCASKKKKEEEEQVVAPVTENAPTIVKQDLSFDVSGSDSGTIKGLYTINFDYDSSTLNASSKKKLEDNAKWIKGQKNTTVQIEGH